MQLPLTHRYRRATLHDRGAALTVGLALLTVCALWGIMTWSTGQADVRTSENYRQMALYYATGQQAFYAAEAGAEAARARLRARPGVTNPSLPAPGQATWQLHLEAPRAAVPPQPAQASAAAGTAATLTYHVTVRQALDPRTSSLLHWGDPQGEGLPVRTPLSGEPLYVITSQGRQGEAQRTVEIEAAPEPPPTVPAALYVGGPLQVGKQRTTLNGLDRCGAQHQPGLRTPLGALAALPLSGQETDIAHVSEGNITITGMPAVSSRSTPLQVSSVLARFKERAEVVSRAAAGTSWGSPQPGATWQDPSHCSARHILAYTPQPGHSASLAPGTTGCGLLLVDGDLVLQGDFTWYGAILVTGSVQLTGGGRKHMTGGMVVAGGISLDADGETSLVYCSEAIAEQTRYLPLRVLSWREVAPEHH